MGRIEGEESDRLNEKIKHLAMDGMSDKRIANHLGVSYDTVYRRRKAMGIEPSGGHNTYKTAGLYTSEDMRRIRELYQAGLSDEEIGEKIGRTAKAVKERRMKMNLKRRQMNRYGRKWTQQDTLDLIEMWESGWTDIEIAEEMHRSPFTVAKHRQGLSLPSKNKDKEKKMADKPKKWTEQQDEVLAKAIRLIAKQMNRTVGAIVARCGTLQKSGRI